VVDRARARQADTRRDQAQKDPPTGTHPAVLAEVLRNGVTDIGEEWHLIEPRPLAADDDFARAPAEVAELERHDLARPQAESGQ